MATINVSPRFLHIHLPGYKSNGGETAKLLQPFCAEHHGHLKVMSTVPETLEHLHLALTAEILKAYNNHDNIPVTITANSLSAWGTSLMLPELLENPQIRGIGLLFPFLSGATQKYPDWAREG